LFFLSFKVIWKLQVAFRGLNTQNRVIGRGVNKGAEEAAGSGWRRRKLRVVVVVRTEVQTEANGGVSEGEWRRTEANGAARGGLNGGI